MPTGSCVSVRHALAAMVATVLAIALAAPAGAQVKPGDVVSASTAYKVKNLVSPGVYYKVTRGMTMDIVPTSAIQWPPPFRDATEKYSEQVRLSPDGRSLVSFIRYRYANPARADDIWRWTPGTRRLRRLNEGIMSDAVVSGGNPTSFDPDHYSGFNAKVEEYNYKLLGQKTMLASVTAKHSPEITCATDGGASACPEDWQMRQLYIVQTSPRRSVNSEALHSKSILYIDGEMWFEPYVDEYDPNGPLWQNHIYWLTYRDRPVPDARIAIYPFKREFVVAAAATDVQSGMTTMCYLPGQNTPEHECWYINMGSVDRNFFTTNAMVRAAP